MEDNYITFDTSKLLHEFDRDAFITSKCYNVDGDPHTVSLVVRRLTQNNNIYYPRIKQSVLHKWLREKYDIHIIPYILTALDLKRYTFTLVRPRPKGIMGCDLLLDAGNLLLKFDKYEDALERGLYETLRNLIDKTI